MGSRRDCFVPADLTSPLSDSALHLKRDIQQRFGHTPHDWQIRAISSVLAGNDVLVTAGTGSGKSLVYQALPLARPGALVLALAPINALIKNQVFQYLLSPSDRRRLTI
jgi:ATP-dependent helicase YprA (DUF1998 family)